jgi:hypothetical protein
VSGLRRIRGNGLALVLMVACCGAARAHAQVDSGGALPEQSAAALADQLMQILTQTGVQLPEGIDDALHGAGQPGAGDPQQGPPPTNPQGVANPYSWQLTPEQRGSRPPPPAAATTPPAVPAGGQGASEPPPSAKPSTPLPPQTIYRWHDRHGRAFYTNSAEAIPEPERERAKVDLSRISLNTELGTELNHRLERRYEALAATPKCEQLRQAAELGFLERMWTDYAPLVVCGGLLLLFVLFTPRALRQFGGPVWSRTLMMAIPALALSGLVLFSMRETNLAVIELQHRAAPCEHSTFDGMGSSPDAVLRRAALVRHLQAIVVPR